LLFILSNKLVKAVDCNLLLLSCSVA